MGRSTIPANDLIDEAGLNNIEKKEVLKSARDGEGIVLGLAMVLTELSQ